MNKIVPVSLLLIFTSTLAQAVSLCNGPSVEACAVTFEDAYIAKYTNIHQAKDSPLSKTEFSARLKDAVGSEQFKNLYQNCTQSATDTHTAISCIHDGFTTLLTQKADNREVQNFIQNTLPQIDEKWDIDTFQKQAVSFFPMDIYPRISKTATLLFGGCTVGNMEEKGHKFEMTYGVSMHDYVARLTCDKIKDAEAEVMVINENGAWKYGRIDIRKHVEIKL